MLQVSRSAARAQDPGVRGGSPAGGPIAGLTARQSEYFQAGKEDFEEAEEVADGLGPTLNLDSCVGCHSQPATGGTSPMTNPQVALANKDGGSDAVSSFITANGPVREAKLSRTLTGHPMAGFTRCSRLPGVAARGGAISISRISSGSWRIAT